MGRGVNCYVKLSNYRKDGSVFQNLLSMHPVHDSNGVYRFCIGLQFDVGSPDKEVLEQRFAVIHRIMGLMPTKVSMGAPLSFNFNEGEEVIYHSLQKAVDCTQTVHGTDVQSNARYANNRVQMLQALGL